MSASTRGYVCARNGSAVDQEESDAGRFCGGHPSCFHVRRPDGGDEGTRAAWEPEPAPATSGRVNGTHTKTSPPRDDWPEPASLVGIPAAPALDLTLFPPEIANVVLDATARMQCPPDYVAWGLVTVIAGLIGPR